MTEYCFFKRNISFGGVAFLVGFLLFLIPLISCSSSKKVQDPEFKILEIKLAKGINDAGKREVVLNPTDTFSSVDTAVVAHVNFANLSGKHRVHWKWFSPDGKLYYTTNKIPIKTPKGKYAQDASTWHKISIHGDRAQHLPGQWRVELHFDNSPIASKHFEIKTDISDIAFDVDLNIPKTKMDKPDAVAVVIGNRHYQHKDIPEVKFARNDADVVKKYLKTMMGYRDGNILFETDITKTKFEILFGIAGDHRGLLNDYIKAGESEVFIYYSGHGAPDVNSNKGYFVPTDCDPSKVAITGYPLSVFYENISKLKAKKISIVLDACFSGGTNSGKWLIGGASPALIKVDVPTVSFDNMTVLTSATSDQVSSWHNEREHGLFTYFFLKAIRGYGDKNKDRNMTIQEVYDSVSDQAEGVPYWSRRLHGGRIQTPMLYGPSSDILTIY
jgi:Caspase domain